MSGREGAAPVLVADDIHVAYGGRPVLDVTALAVREGEVLAVIGPNGAGKSTLLRVLALLETPARGTVAFRANNGTMVLDAAIAGLGIALLPTFIAGAAVKAGRLRVIDVGAQPEQEWIYLAHAEGRQPSAKLRALADCLRKAFGDPATEQIEIFALDAEVGRAQQARPLELGRASDQLGLRRTLAGLISRHAHERLQRHLTQRR